MVCTMWQASREGYLLQWWAFYPLKYPSEGYSLHRNSKSINGTPGSTFLWWFRQVGYKSHTAYSWRIHLASSVYSVGSKICDMANSLDLPDKKMTSFDSLQFNLGLCNLQLKQWDFFWLVEFKAQRKQEKSPTSTLFQLIEASVHLHCLLPWL